MSGSKGGKNEPTYICRIGYNHYKTKTNKNI